MRRTRVLLNIALVALCLAGAADPAGAQAVEVTSGAEKVTVDGDTVRIEEPSGTTVVRSDWRTGAVTVETDTEQILVDLGAVTVDDRIQLNLAGDILFDFDSAAVRADAAAQLAKVAQVIRSRSVGDVYVIGHTDSIGAEDYNLKLSRDRAASVMRWLNRNEGIPASVMVGNGLGAKRPVAHNTNPDGSDSPEGRAKNRRVEIQMATREGVRVGPDVIIAPGGVRVSAEGVSVAGGAIQIDESGVRVGGVKVGVGGVEVDAGATGSGDRVVIVEGEAPEESVVITSRARVVDDESPVACDVGEECTLRCPYGDCKMKCRRDGSCTFFCGGGDCLMDCNTGATCSFYCGGGDCGMKCEPGATCSFNCGGGDCLYHCLAGADCSTTCGGGECVCKGAGC